MARWIIWFVLMGLLLNVTATDKDKLEESETDRSKRQYKRRPAALKSGAREEEGVVQYDSSGLGFEIQKPGSFQYQFRPIFPSENKPYSPEPASYEEPYPQKPSYHEPKPYSPKPAYAEYEPEYGKPKPTYKQESHYHGESYPKPNKPNHYGDSKPEYDYYCPKIAGYESQCRLAKDCAVWYDLAASVPGTACQLSYGDPGICCPDIPYNGMNRVFFQFKLTFQWIDLICCSYSFSSYFAAAHVSQKKRSEIVP